MSRTRQPPNTANVNQDPYANLDFSEPPDVQILEASCELAQKRSADNSEWTNILKEPIFCAKGSEIRCASSFLDMKGMDSEIIQFESSGNSQDNSHTLLSSIYTVNDGFNGKTSSYDYICRPQLTNIPANSGKYMNDSYEMFRIHNYGSGITTGNFVMLSVATGQPTTLTMTLESSGLDKVLTSLTISSAGTNYRTGDALVFAHTVAPTIIPTGYIIANDLGQVTNFVIEDPGSFKPTDVPTVTVTNNTGGSGCSLAIVLSDPGAVHTAKVAVLGSGLVEYQFDGTSTGVYQATGTNFQMIVLAVDAAGSLLNKTMFDQGYNYQRVPLFRYCQTFDINNNLTFGNHFLDRTFTTGAGNTVTIDNRPIELAEDSSLSAYGSIKRREDEFAPGIFHNKGIEDGTPFLMTSAFTRLGYSNQNLNWLFGWENGYSVIYAVNINVNNDPTGPTGVMDVNGYQEDLEGNILCRYPTGTCLSISFQVDQSYTTNTDKTKTEWQTMNLNRLWGGVFQVGKNEYINFGNQITIEGVNYTSYRKITLGSPSLFLSDPVGALFYLEYNVPNGVPDNLNGPPNSSADLDLINVRRDANGETMNGAGGVLRVAFGAGGNWNGYTLQVVGAGYKKGDILKVNNPDGSGNNVLWYVSQVDNQNGTTFAAPQTTTLERGGLINHAGLPNAVDYACFISPLPYVEMGLGNITNANNWRKNTNGITLVKTEDRVAGQNHFVNYPTYPPTFETFGLEPSDSIVPDNFVNKNAQNCRFKNSGLSVTDKNYNVHTGKFASHNLMSYASDGSVAENTTLSIEHSHWLWYKKTLSCTVGAIGSGADMLPVDSDQQYMDIRESIILAAVGGAGNEYLLPTNYLKMKITYPSTDQAEEHVIISHSTTFVDNAVNYNRYWFKCRSTHYNQFYNFYTADADFDGLYGNKTPSNVGLGFGYKIEASDINPAMNAGAVVELKWVTDESQFLNQIVVKWHEGDGNIAFTSSTNFYNKNDSNYNTLTKIPVWNNILNNNQEVSTEELNSYNDGGNYYLTHVNGYLTNLAKTNPDAYDYSSNYGFCQGFNEFLITRRLPGEYVANRNAEFFVPQNSVVKQLETNCSNVFGYERLYKQKTFTIDRDFAIPSDIGGFWTRESHELTGIQDSLTGQELATVDDCGILQNEFIFPVYGANNKIDAKGRYISDLLTYPDSAGLEPGHVIGIQGIDRYSNYLSNQVKYSLPIDSQNNKISFVFFRTFFTSVRNYDPLKVDNTSGIYPNRQAFETIETKAGLIGNVSFRTGYVKAVAAGGGNPPDPPAVAGVAGVLTNKYTLDGSLLIDGTSQGPGGPGQQDTFSHKMYELGQPNPPNASDPAYFPSSSTEYPVRYLDNDVTNTYARAKISSFCGSTNMTLAYQQDLSTFAFEFFYTPYTSPYEDGTGGDISSRIFFGNRPKGVYNHDCLGGVNVQNWCRPDYPRNIITYRESLNNMSSSYYPNGVNPVTGVASIGRAFLNKLGFTDKDIAVVVSPSSGLDTIDPTATNIGNTQVVYQDTITIDDGTQHAFQSYNFTMDRTNKAAIDTSVAILAAIPAPESAPGLNSHVQVETPANGRDKKIFNRWGDYIFYPYSIDSSTNTFNSTGTGSVADPVEASKVRWDNATDTYASVGGLNLSEVGRGMGTPNTTGSTTICNPTTIPVTLNPDCNIFLSYTVQTDSDYILASGLPRKLNHGHLIVISNLIDKPNYHLSQAGAVNGISVVNKSFITGDFILSIGQLSFYATEDRWLSRITTKIVNSSYEAPTTLGKKSTIIYSIVNNNPKPAQAPTPIVVQQEKDYQMMSYLQEHLNSKASGQTSRLQDLHNNLYQLGIATIVDPLNKNASIISKLEQYIQGYDLVGMRPEQRRAFYATPEGGAFLSAATNYGNIVGQVDSLEQATNPSQEARIMRNVGLQMRAIDRGHILPPVPTADAGAAPPILEDFEDHLNQDTIDRSYETAMIYDPESGEALLPPELQPGGEELGPDADGYVPAGAIADFSSVIRGTGMVGEPTLVDGEEGRTPSTGDSGISGSGTSIPPASGGASASGTVDSGMPEERPDTP